MTKTKKSSLVFAALGAICAGAFILTKPDDASSAVSGAVKNCLEIIIPSLFAFTVLAIFLRDSGLYRVVLKPLSLPLSRLLRMDEELCACIILGNIGGYPVGAKLLSNAVEEHRLSEQDAGRLLCCCFGSGPSFVIGIAGMRVFDNAATGAAIFAACFLSSLIMAAIVRSRGEINFLSEKQACAPSAKCFIDAVISAAKVMFTVCAMITIFSVITALLKSVGALWLGERLLDRLGFGADADKIFPALLEISALGELAGESPLSASICAGLLSFGGVCVLLQIAAISKKLPLKSFLLTRPLAAAISFILALPAALIPRTAAAAIPAGSTARPFSAGAAASVCVLIMCGILLSGEKSR